MTNVKQILFRPTESLYLDMKAAATMHGYSLARFMLFIAEEQMKRYKSGGFKSLQCGPVIPIREEK